MSMRYVLLYGTGVVFGGTHLTHGSVLRITPAELGGPEVVPGVEPRPAACQASTLPMYFLSCLRFMKHNMRSQSPLKILLVLVIQ